MTVIASREVAQDTTASVAKLMFEVSIAVARAHGMSGPNALAQMASAIGIIMHDNELSTATALLRAIADFVEDRGEATETKLSEAVIAFTLANDQASKESA